MHQNKMLVHLKSNGYGTTGFPISVYKFIIYFSVILWDRFGDVTKTQFKDD